MNIFSEALKELEQEKPNKVIIKQALELGKTYQSIEKTYQESEEALNKKKYEEYRKITARRNGLKRQAKNFDNGNE